MKDETDPQMNQKMKLTDQGFEVPMVIIFQEIKG